MTKDVDTIEGLKEEIEGLCNRIAGLRGQINHLKAENELRAGGIKGVASAITLLAGLLSEDTQKELEGELRREIDSLRQQATTGSGTPSPYWTNEKSGELRALKAVLNGVGRLS